MAPITKDDFLKTLKASNVIEAERLEQLLVEIDVEDPRQLALRLVEQKELTRWQAKYLMGGRHILHIGNYRLLERLDRDETLGDLFVAKHVQLGRKVQLQVLPAALEKKEAVRKRFMDKATSVAQLDHPNLTHVFDIDREGGRLVLVTEHADSQSLIEHPVEELSDGDVARIVQQVLAGCLEAHRHGIVHGQIDRSKIMITRENTIKLRHLALSALDDIAVKTDPKDDLNAVGRIGIELLAITSHSAGPKPKKQLFDLLSWLSTSNQEGVEKILAKLDEWVNVFCDSMNSSISSLDVGPRKSSPKRNSETSGRNPAVPTPAKAKPTQEPNTSGSNLRTSLPPKKVSPVTLAITLAVGGLLLVGGVTAFAFAMSKRPGTADNKKTTVKNQQKKQNGKSSQKKRAGIDAPPLKSDLDLGDSKLQLAEMLENGKNQQPDRTPTAQPQTKQPAPPKPESEVKAPPNQAPAESETPEKVPNKPESTTPKATTPKPTPPKAPGEAKPKPKKPGNAFEKFPRVVDLPESNQSAESKIGQIFGPSNYLLIAELITGKTISKSRLSFELQRDESDKQKWIVQFKRRPSDPLVPVAQFRYDGNELHFQWLASAAQEESVNYLRNCQLKLSAKDKIHFLTLRKPLAIEGFQLSQEDLSLKLDTELGWLPDPESLIVELDPFKYGDLSAQLVNRVVKKRTPGVVFFSEKENQKFVWLEVSADLRKKLRLNLALKTSLPKFRKKLSFLELLTGIGQDLKAKADFASAKYEQVKDLDTPEGMNWEDWRDAKKRMKADADKSQALASDTLEMAEKLKPLFENPVPLTVSFDLNGSKVTLARVNPGQPKQ